MAKLINGNGNPAVYASEDSDWFAAIMGNVTSITAIGEQFRADQADANTIEVFDGVIITKEGRRIQLDANDVDLFTIPTGTPGDTSYYIIGYHLVTDADSNQSCETFVQKMEDGTETIPEDTFRGGADDVYISLYRVTQDGLNIDSIDLLLPYINAPGENKPIQEYAVCITAAATAEKTANIDGFELKEGAKVIINFAYKNTAVGPTLNISGTGAKEIRKRADTSTYNIYKDINYGPLTLVYDGTYWLVEEGGSTMKCVKFGTVSCVNGTNASVDVSSFGFSSAEDYFVILSGGVSANFWVCISSKTATAFSIQCGQVSAGATVSYQVISLVG